jgi:hypothetical protein
LMAHSSRRSMFRGAYSLMSILLLGEALLQSVVVVVVVVVDTVGEEEKG